MDALVVTGLRQALLDSGLSQAQMARALGTSASRFSTYVTGRTMPSAAVFVRVQQLGKAFAAAGQRGWLTPLAAAGAIRSAVRDGDRVWALRLVLQCRDHCRAALALADGSAVGAWTVDPGSTGAGEMDLLLAGLIGHEFETVEQPAPAWTVSTVPGGPWLFRSPFFTDAEVETATPSWLRDRGVLIAARDLVTV